MDEVGELRFEICDFVDDMSPESQSNTMSDTNYFIFSEFEMLNRSTNNGGGEHDSI